MSRGELHLVSNAIVHLSGSRGGQRGREDELPQLHFHQKEEEEAEEG